MGVERRDVAVYRPVCAAAGGDGGEDVGGEVAGEVGEEGGRDVGFQEV